MNKAWIVTFPGVKGTSGQFVVMAEDKKSAVETAWNSTDSQFQITHQKEAAQVKDKIYRCSHRKLYQCDSKLYCYLSRRVFLT